ncbi:K02A2.6-like [Cordylochernes scorpioides]|uniref:RNA-directed DNA polymerase n=1 Tax=Cordylochernes scorpioides TaxID=51811 RepID=A0ABY6K2U2_9ARAC|nr:K02A2.6-like [Cordylochernes scorpioides]
MDFVRPSELALHGNVAENWRRFKQRLMLYLEATEKATKPDKLKVAILLNFIGEEALEVFNTFHLKEDEAENFDLVINKFDDFCEPKKNVIFERFKFFSATQKDGESIDSFITELKGLSTSCEFESQKDSLIRDRIVYGIQGKALQERLLREPNLTLLKAIEMCKTDEISKQQIKIMQNNQNICQIRKYEKKHSPKQNQESEKEFKCQRCGKSHRAKNCPAWGKRCSKCKKMNHFAAFCKSSAIRSLNDETEETVWSIHEAKVVHTLEWKKSIIVNGKEICFKLDSGAEVNVLPYTFTRQMKGLEIFQTNRKLTSYTGHEIKIKGIATLNCKTKNKTESLEFFIADGYYQPILGIEAIEKLSLIKKCDAVQTEQNNSTKEILNRHKNIFEGIGRLPIEHKIRLKENATPVIAPSRKIPFSIREKVKAELERMEKLDIIEKVEEPSEWTHPIVVVQKPSGDVRICMDPRELNKYVQRERYILPTAETIFSELKGATVFSVFDASSAFWQVPLDKESTNLCTIATPFGRFRFKRLPYGLNSASEVFQRCINNILSGLQGTACYMDDILIYGNTMEEHNRNLETVLRRLEENNVKLNAKKQQIAVNKVNFLGHIISRDGIAIQASRAEAIQKLKRPENKTEVQRFLDMVTYLGKFIPNLSDKTAPLRKLISNKSEWKFGGEENDCFEKLKNMVSNAPILTFFDPTKPITISSDASQYGIGTVLMQGGQAIEYASFSLNATQRKYAQIEKELLAIVFGCERFQYYIWGNDVIVETDHKPLLSIVKKPLEKLSPRLQRMVLRLMRFQISLKFAPGKNMFVADHLSRDSLKDEVDTSYLEGQTESVHMLLVTTDEKIKRLQKETHGDHTLIQLIEYAKNGWPKYKTKVCDEAKPYWQFQDEIHVSDGIVYKGNCIMVPSTLRKEILQVVHSSHQGIAASKEKARSAFYWPGMITQVENEVEKCRTCQEYSRKNPEESRIAHEIPEFPWEKIAVDFMEVSGTSSILVVDYHSKFVEIRKLSSKRETETIMQLKTIFRTHGIPRSLVSDNGPPFNSTGFKNFAQKYEFKHQTSSPKYPRSNGQVERTIQTIKGLIIKAVKSGRDPNLALMEFNNTPKYDLPSPTQMLMGRSVRTLSTYTRQQLKPLFDTTKNYQKLRDHQQKYAGSPKRILRPLEVGDNIMLQERHRKWVPATVTAKHETPRSYMVKTPSGSEYRRNRSHLRPRKFSVEDSAPTSQSPSIPGSQAGTAMDDNIQDHGRPTSENRRAYDPREDIAKKVVWAQQNPTISFISKEQVHNIGDTAELKCEVQYESQYSVLWNKLNKDNPNNNQVISSGSSLIFNYPRYSIRHEKNGYILTIKKLQEIDAGLYQCQIVTGSTTKITADVILYIRIQPVISDNSTRSVITTVGKSVDLYCYATGYPKPRISWRRESNELLPNGAAMYIGNVLHMPRIKKSDRGTYYCVADNGVAHGARRNIGVEVEFAPVVTVDRPRYGQALQYNMDLQCRVEAFPSPSIQWWFGGELLQNSQHQRISIFPTADEFTETNLQIITIEKRQYGNYSCRAMNKLGSDEKTIVLFEKNVIYELALFNSRMQEEGEPINEFITNLYILAESCEYDSINQVVRMKERQICTAARVHKHLYMI